MHSINDKKVVFYLKTEINTRNSEESLIYKPWTVWIIICDISLNLEFSDVFISSFMITWTSPVKTICIYTEVSYLCTKYSSQYQLHSFPDSVVEKKNHLLVNIYTQCHAKNKTITYLLNKTWIKVNESKYKIRKKRTE